MHNLFEYHMPTKIIYGVNALDEAKKLINGRKTILITSDFFLNNGLVDKLVKNTPEIVFVVSDLNSYPDFSYLKKVYDKISSIDFELILAIGGGSVIDTSKFLSLQNKNIDFSFVEGLTRGKTKNTNCVIKPIIAIPTTAGTGSELTPWATVWDFINKEKHSLHLSNLFCKFAIYDPSLTLTLSKEITLQTSLDSLSHALESIWNKNANEITVEYAIRAAKLIIKYLPKLIKELSSLKYRDQIMKASMYSALAFSNTQTAIAHSFSYDLTLNKNIPHGIACSFTLPELIDNVVGKYLFIDEAIKTIFGELSSVKLRRFLKELNISTNFSDYGLTNIEVEIIKNNIKHCQRANNSLVNL